MGQLPGHIAADAMLVKQVPPPECTTMHLKLGLACSALLWDPAQCADCLLDHLS